MSDKKLTPEMLEKLNANSLLMQKYKQWERNFLIDLRLKM